MHPKLLDGKYGTDCFKITGKFQTIALVPHSFFVSLQAYKETD